jgi:hypothetical protein
MSDITELKRVLEGRALEVAEHLLPRGMLEGQEWCAGTTAGAAGKSLKVRVRGSKVGRWSDFAAGGESGDLIDLWQAVKRLSLIDALEFVSAGDRFVARAVNPFKGNSYAHCSPRCRDHLCVVGERRSDCSGRST